eukprot:CAMPEP_0175932192 /NCGR_PEP_ID=MMETSP0108-20121206/19261_1 /TAXON_ID=195067 ORGANISM="Goniomonas pacifica, Strain CCMP1869" /NCGR_SAMPLE_ID=MMETSP0108 /ASSEMBLY_ACC=CAM_ASM_000204 /LENGTH=171 /DNA_ID=CAMNT_0017255819 /DNA_START=75 /DNA_END=590 /DNA_ORIENTATION=+
MARQGKRKAMKPSDESTKTDKRDQAIIRYKEAERKAALCAEVADHRAEQSAGCDPISFLARKKARLKAKVLQRSTTRFTKAAEESCQAELRRSWSTDCTVDGTSVGVLQRVPMWKCNTSVDTHSSCKVRNGCDKVAAERFDSRSRNWRRYQPLSLVQSSIRLERTSSNYCT